MKKLIYLDNASSTRCDERVIDFFFPLLKDIYGNPSNTIHLQGFTANELVNNARLSVSDCFNCLSNQIVWTSGATESNNLAIMGAINAEKKINPGRRIHLITSSIEHKSVLSPIDYLRQEGADVTYIHPSPNGCLSISEIEDAINDSTVLISVMYVNNETGIINDINTIGKIASSRGILLHTDATQAVGKLDIDLRKLDVDFLSFSGHKVYAPKGIGGLYVRDPDLLFPILYGGGHERHLRPGTLNTPGIAAIGKAIEICFSERIQENIRISTLRDKLESELLNFNNNLVVNGFGKNRVSNISSITFPVKKGIKITDYLKEIAFSTGAACDSHDQSPSHVMIKLGKSIYQAKNTLRFSLGRFTTEEEIDEAILEIKSKLKFIC